ncbi:MAG: rRNA (uracil1939-C5)-methyltransferase, partial [Clostridiales bacterium]|nr:rRNA (uracil1939-C5)-methyltransferase [Clostridiales bacterium]
NPATLARDSNILNEYGYNMGKAMPLDMFPQTSHVECVTLMSKP